MEKSSTYKAAVLEKYGGKLEIKDLPHRELKDHEVLVKIKCFSFLPSDLFFLQGQYAIPPQLPKVPGNEGAGIVEAVGKKVDQSLVGKHVGIMGSHSIQGIPDSSGVWAEYSYTIPNFLFAFDETVEFEKICNTLVNPLTAAGFVDTAKSMGVKAIGHTGASSPLGRMLLRLCVKEGLEIVNIVRKQESIDEMTQMGGKHFINTSEKGWEKKLAETCEKLDVKMIFDSVGADVTGKCLQAIVPGGTVYHYGNLTAKMPTDIMTGDLIFKKKTLTGWWLVWYIQEGKNVTYYKDLIKADLQKDGEIFKTEFRATYEGFDNFFKAFEDYVTKGSGKVLFKP